MNFDIVIIGGLGHVGLPLGISFADKNLKVCLYDLDTKKSELVRQGKMPFIEYGAEPILKKVIENGNLTISSDPHCISSATYVIIAIGTPVDQYLNPKTREFLESIKSLKHYLTPGQLIIIRSTVYPRTCQQVQALLGSNFNVVYCPERIVQGYAMKELHELPQIVAGFDEKSTQIVADIFRILTSNPELSYNSKNTDKIIRTTVPEAELAKLFSNALRYIQFAVTNQFYEMSHSFGVDYNRVRKAMMEGYGRNAALPGAGFAAGPCLIKDTMQLAAFNTNNFQLGYAAMAINEGLPNFIVEDLRKQYDLSKTSVGILGMAFKADIDDIRDSLSYKLGKILRFHGANVYYSDEYATDPTFVSKETLIDKSDVIIVGVPHTQYKGLNIPKSKRVIDLWGITTQ